MADLFTKRNIIIALSLGIVVLALVPGIKLIQQQQQIRSRAEDLPECSQITEECTEENWGEVKNCKYNNSCASITCGQEDTEEEVCDENGENCYKKYKWNTPQTKACTVEDPPPGENEDCHSGGCPVDSTKPICETSTNTCRPCKTGDNCGGNYRCDTGSGKCILSSNTPPATSLAPGSQCDIAGRQSPSVGDSCTNCIVANNGGAQGLIRGIRGSCTVSNVGKSDKEMVNYWCNGGLGQAASQDCNVKKAACGTACGGAAVSPSPSVSSIPPTTPPGQPTLSASCPTGSTTPTLTWNSVPGAVSYDVRVNNHKGTASFTRKDCGPHSVCVNNYTSTSLTFQGSSDGDYRAWVQAIGPNRTGGGVSNTVAFQCVPPSTPPSSPSPSVSPSPSESSRLTCDFNNDGKYDDKDFKIWSDEFTGQKRGLKADCNGDGKVDLIDFNLWRDQKIDRE